MDLRQQLGNCLDGRVCVMGLGNTDYGDDGFGVRLAEKLMQSGLANVVIAGNMPERFVGQVSDGEFDRVLFLDAVEFGSAPGSVALLNSEEMASKFPQVSTHKISLGLLAKWAEANGTTQAWLLGAQPESLKTGAGISQTVQTTLGALSDLLCEVIGPRQRITITPARPSEELNA